MHRQQDKCRRKEKDCFSFRQFCFCGWLSLLPLSMKPTTKRI
ncbi:hypothetical protein BACEGG_03754, partial [Bacteroides eggerthii DSM 20697]